MYLAKNNQNLYTGNWPERGKGTVIDLLTFGASCTLFAMVTIVAVIC
jgi:hypothetical protein